MMFVWNKTCRRLRESGSFSRLAGEMLAESERGAVEAHLAGCPACAAEAADCRAVAHLLHAQRSVAPPPGGLAASGKLWSTLESEIRRTPQDKATPAPVTTAAFPSGPRLQRVGYWLATPGALPFGAVAGAAVVAMIGIVIFHRGELPPAAPRAVAAAAPEVAPLNESAFTEIRLDPSLGARAKSSSPPMAVRAQAAPVRPLPAMVARAAASDTLHFTPRRGAIRETRRVSPPRVVFVASAPLLTAPRPAVLSALVKPNINGKTVPLDQSVASAPAPAPTPFLLASAKQAPENSLKQEFYAAGNMAATAGVAVLPPPPLSPTEVLGVHSEREEGDLREVPAVRSIAEMALRLRRQRSLFSYATR